MERKKVSANLTTLIKAVKEHTELLVSNEDQDLLVEVSKEEFENENNHRRRDRAKFVLSKTTAFSPSVFDEDNEIKSTLMGLLKEIVTYLTNRSMAPIAELINELIVNEKDKDASHFDYNYKSGQ